MIQLTHDRIDPAALLASVQSTDAGAVVLFLGTVRELTGELRTLRLSYDAYAPMAEKELISLAAEARRNWPVIGLAIVHRLGDLELGEISVAVAVSCPHRREAFAAGQFLIDELKVRVPIWKQEHWADGRTEWIHPAGTEQPPGEPPTA